MEWVIDLGLIAACVLVIYFQRQRRPRWAPPLAISCLVIAGFVWFAQTPTRTTAPPAQPMPTPAQLRTSFESSAVEAPNDVDYRGEGFRLTIPAGYRYAKLQAPAMLLATRGDGATTINVLRHEVGAVDTENLLRDMLAGMKQKNATYEFGPLEGGRTWFRVTKNGVPLRGLLLFEVRDERLWQLTLTEPASAEDAALLRIAQGWEVD